MEVPIYFYLPREKWLFDAEPSEVDCQFVKDVSQRFFNGPSWSWTLQTYLQIRLHDFPCHLVDEIPGVGVVVVARGDLDFWHKPSARQLFVCMLADGGFHPWAQVQVSQNPIEAKRAPGGVFTHHWPQPGLIPRDKERGARFENVAFFGHPDQLAFELKGAAWQRFLRERGLTWVPVHQDSNRKSDYSDIDLVVAIRGFDDRRFDRKPATKLHNAWRAGVPAILGAESAYRAERNSPDDYIEAMSYEEVCGAVDRLREDEVYRVRLTTHAATRGRSVGFKRQAERWAELIENVALPRYEEWVRQTDFARRLYFVRRYVEMRLRGVAARVGL